MFDTSEDVRIFKREGKWYYTPADSYNDGPYSDGDEEGPYATLMECCVALAQESKRVT